MSGIRRGLHSAAGFDGHKQWKAPGKEGHLTLGELAKLVDRDKRRITQLERQGRLPSPIRVKHGSFRVRLYNPEQVKVVQRFFKKIEASRPKKSGPKRLT